MEEPAAIDMIQLVDSAVVSPASLAPDFVSVVVGVVVQTFLRLIVVHSDRYLYYACPVFLASAIRPLEVVHSCFQSPIDHSDHPFPTFHPLLVVAVLAVPVVLEEVCWSSRIEQVQRLLELLDLAVAILVIVVLSRCSKRARLAICESHLPYRHRLLRILVGGGGCCICWLWR